METTLNLKTTLSIKASATEVWHTLTHAELVKQYFFGTDLVTDWQVGSPIFFRGEWDGVAYEDKGTVLAFEPERYLCYNYWSSFSQIEDIPENYATIEYILEAVEEGTNITITQNGLKDEEAIAHSESNWQMIMGEMRKLVEK
jgi:uncharacterized protein YndB with AHSA1/START domain